MATAVATGRCEKCRQTRPLFTFSYVPIDWFEFVEVQLCARDYSAATLQDEREGLAYGDFTSQTG